MKRFFSSLLILSLLAVPSYAELGETPASITAYVEGGVNSDTALGSSVLRVNGTGRDIVASAVKKGYIKVPLDASVAAASEIELSLTAVSGNQSVSVYGIDLGDENYPNTTGTGTNGNVHDWDDAKITWANAVGNDRLTDGVDLNAVYGNTPLDIIHVNGAGEYKLLVTDYVKAVWNTLPPSGAQTANPPYATFVLTGDGSGEEVKFETLEKPRVVLEDNFNYNFALVTIGQVYTTSYIGDQYGLNATSVARSGGNGNYWRSAADEVYENNPRSLRVGDPNGRTGRAKFYNSIEKYRELTQADLGRRFEVIFPVKKGPATEVVTGVDSFKVGFKTSSATSEWIEDYTDIAVTDSWQIFTFNFEITQAMINADTCMLTFDSNVRPAFLGSIKISELPLGEKTSAPKLIFNGGVNKYVSAASYVMPGSNQRKNFGKEDSIQVNGGAKLTETVDGAGKVYAKFNAKNYTDAEKIELIFTTAEIADQTVNVYGIIDSNWEPDTLTWNNAPIGTTLVTSVYVTAAGEYKADVTDFVKAVGNADITFVLAAAKNQKKIYDLNFDGDFGLFSLYYDYSFSDSEAGAIVAEAGNNLFAITGRTASDLLTKLNNTFKNAPFTNADLGRRFKISMKAYAVNDNNITGNSGINLGVYSGFYGSAETIAAGNTSVLRFEPGAWTPITLDYTVTQEVIDKKGSMLSFNQASDYMFSNEIRIDDILVEEISTDTGTSVLIVPDSLSLFASTSDPQGMLSYILGTLTWDKISKQPINDIRYDIALPKTGALGSMISWSSSANDIINSSGEINKTSLIEDNTLAKLTATITFGGVSAQKSFDIKLAKRGWENKIISETVSSFNPYIFAADGQTDLEIRSDAAISITAQKSNCDNGKLAVTDISGEIIKSVIIEGDNLSVDGMVIASLPDDAPFELSFMILPDVNRVAVRLNGELKGDYLPITSSFDGVSAITCNGSGLSISKAEVFLDDYGILNLNIDKLGYLKLLSQRTVDSDITFITEAFLDSSVSWNSSNISVIDNNGVVSQGKGVGFCNITFTVSNSRASVQNTETIAVLPDESIPTTEAAATMYIDRAHPAEHSRDNKLDTYLSGTLYSGRENSITITLSGNDYINQLFIAEFTPSIKKYKLEMSQDGVSFSEIAVKSVNGLESFLSEFSPIKTKYIKITLMETSDTTVNISEIAALLNVTGEWLAAIDLDEIEIDASSKITSNLTLPIFGSHNSQIQWKSSVPSVISANGVYTAPEYDTNVILTASIIVNGKAVEKSFTVTAAGTKGSKGAGVISGGSSSGGGGGGSASFPVVTNPEAVNDKQAFEIFSDLPSEHWAYYDVKRLKEAGIVSGDEEGKFNPDEFITREQFMKMLVTSRELPIVHSEENIFADVYADAWYADYITSAYNAGIVNGISPDSFGIGITITRQDAAVMLFRALSLENVSDAVLFGDDSSIADYASEAVYAMRKAGYINGYDGNVFMPLNFITRAEAAAIISRIL